MSRRYTAAPGYMADFGDKAGDLFIVSENRTQDSERRANLVSAALHLRADNSPSRFIRDTRLMHNNRRTTMINNINREPMRQFTF